MNAATLAVKAVDEADTRAATRRRRPAPDASDGVLAPRERQIMQLINGGRTSKEVAFELGLSDATVRVLISRARKKLGHTGRGPAISRR